MIGLLVLLSLLGVASFTDLRTERIPNWLTFGGIALGLLGAGMMSLFLGTEFGGVWGMGMPLFPESLAGLALASFLMVFCYVVFAGQVGGGDVKLLAMVGAFLGPYNGIEVMLWTFVIGAASALIRLIWLGGATRVLTRGIHYLVASLRGASRERDVARERESGVANAAPHTPLYLAPCTLAGVVTVLWLQPWLLSLG